MHTEYESEPVSSETRLWKAVLWRAFDDLFYKGLERSLVVAKKSAKLWFQNRDNHYKYDWYVFKVSMYVCCLRTGVCSRPVQQTQKNKTRFQLYTRTKKLSKTEGEVSK